MLGLLGAAAFAQVPQDGQISFQDAHAPMMEEIVDFHNIWLMPIITAITLFVLALLLWIIVRYNRRANPNPAKWHHNTLIEVVWTVVPVLILIVLAVPGFKLLFFEDNIPETDMTIKAVGYQWYWGYEYPDQNIGEYISTMLSENDASEGVYLLETDYPLVAPAGKVVRVEITAADVIHSFALPSFGMKTDAIPGRVNLDWFIVDEPGSYYGQCSELCGIRHAFMPIHIEIVPQPVFDAWAAAKADGDFDAAKELIVAYKETGDTRLALAQQETIGE